MPKVKCEVCGRWFRNKENLKKHLANKHSQGCFRVAEGSETFRIKTEEANHTQPESKRVISIPSKAMELSKKKIKKMKVNQKLQKMPKLSQGFFLLI